MTSLLEHPRTTRPEHPDQPGDRNTFSFETTTRLPDSADGKGRGGARYGRTGVIHTPHGDIKTPAFVPVATQAAMKAVLPEQMRELGAQCLLSNAFHLFERPGEDVLDEAGGLGRFMNWDGPTFTDSGGFQVLSLGAGFKKTLAMDVKGMKSDDVIAKGKERLAFVDEDGVTFKSPLNGSEHRFSAEISMGIQHKIGADIMFAFDELTTLMNTRGYQERSVERTFRWARRCVAEHQRLTQERIGKPYQALYGVVQGANYEDLRRHAAQQIASLDFDGVGIGGAIEKRVIGDTCAGSATKCRKADPGMCSASRPWMISSPAWRTAATPSTASRPREPAATARSTRATAATTSNAPPSNTTSDRSKRAATATPARIIRGHISTICCVRMS
jgi:queuine tRNA-ribosyltransferase